MTNALEPSYDKIANAMGLTNVMRLRDPWNSAATRELMSRYFQAEQNRFGASTATKPDYPTTTSSGLSGHGHTRASHLRRDAIWFLAAEPMYKPVLDMCGYLSLLAEHIHVPIVDERPDIRVPRDFRVRPDESWIECYRFWSEIPLLPAGSEARPYALLAPEALAQLAKRGQLSYLRSLDILPIIHKLCLLQRHPKST